MEDLIKIEAQKYKVFNNNKLLIIGLFDESEKRQPSPSLTNELYDFITANSGNQKLKISTDNPQIVLTELASRFKIVKAAGGIVKSNLGNLLVIKRNGLWDLPKGKIEKNEDIDKAAIREVEEECGIKNLELIKFELTTFHVYFRNQWIFKPTYWYSLKAEESSLEPQLEEGITEAKWQNPNKIHTLVNQSFPSLAPVFTRFLKIA